RFRPVAWAGIAMVAAFLGTGLLTINDISTDWLLWACLGMVAAATAQPTLNAAGATSATARDRPRAPRITVTRRIIAWTCVVAGLATIALAPAALEASRRSQFAQESRLAGRYSQAIDASLNATHY